MPVPEKARGRPLVRKERVKIGGKSKMAKPAAKKGVRTRKKERKHVDSGVAHIHSTFNNTIVTISDPIGNVLIMG